MSFRINTVDWLNARIDELEIENESIRAEHRCVTSNLAKALMPDSPRECAEAEFFLDAMGACQIIRRKLSELAEAKQDTERLDWLERHPFITYRQRDYETRQMPSYFVLVDEDAPGSRIGILKDSIREAIDTARKRVSR